jgi:hypothetical protein
MYASLTAAAISSYVVAQARLTQLGICLTKTLTFALLEESPIRAQSPDHIKCEAYQIVVSRALKIRK